MSEVLKVLATMGKDEDTEVSVPKNLINPMVFDDDKKNKLINPMTFDAPTKSFEDKIYIVLIELESSDNLFDGQYKVCNGRTDCYRYLEKLFEIFGSDINAYRSKVITETKQTESETGNTKYYLMPYDEIASVYTFCKSVESYYGDTAFNIEEFVSDLEEDEEESEDDVENAANSIDIETIINRQAALTGISAKQLNELRNTTSDSVSTLFGHLNDTDGVNV